MQEAAAHYGVRFKPITDTRLRAVTHLDIGDEHVRHAIAAVRSSLAADDALQRRLFAGRGVIYAQAVPYC